MEGKLAGGDDMMSGNLWERYRPYSKKKIFETGLGMAEVENYRQRRFFLLPSLLRALI
jgi:hypothetical protein